MKKKKFNGRGAEECKELDWVELSLSKEAEKEKKSESTGKTQKPAGSGTTKQSNTSANSKKPKKKKSAKKENQDFDIEDVEDGFDLEFDDRGRLIEDKEVSIRKSVDEKIIIKSEELKQKRNEKGFWKRRNRENNADAVKDKEETINFRDKKGLDKYRKMGVLPSKENGPSSFRKNSANWRDKDVDEVNFIADENEVLEVDESFWDSITTASRATCLAAFMAVVLFVMSILTTCAYADYRGAQNKWAAIDEMPQYKETRLPSYSDRQIDTLEVEMLEVAGRRDQEHKILSLVLTSVEKDLKIKLVDDTDTLVKNKKWGVIITDDYGDESSFDDDDMDGIIHITGISAGDYSVAMRDSTDLTGYEYPTVGQLVSVKAKVEYKVIANIRDEIKKESEVNVELEDPNGNQAADEESGEQLSDTVEWVESSQSEGGEGFEEAFVDLSMTEKLYAFAGDVVTAIERIGKATRTRITGNYAVGLQMMPLLLAEAVENDNNTTSVDSIRSDATQILDDLINNITPQDDEVVESDFPFNIDPTTLFDNGEDEETDDSVSEIRSVTIDKSSVSIPKNGQVKLNLSYSPSNAVPYSVQWTSDDYAIASVVDGTVVGISSGTTRITALVNNYYYVYCDVTVTNADANAKVSISGASTIGVGESVVLEAVNSQSGDNISGWYSQNTGIVSLAANGNRATVTGLRAGTVIITAKSELGVEGTIEIKVTGGTGREYADEAQLYDSEKNRLYVYDGGDYRLAKYRDYKSGNFLKYYRKCGEILYTGWQTIDGLTYYYTEDHERVKGEQIIGGVAYSFDDDGALNKGDGILGIDVSKYQPSINWESVKASGISYVIIRCGYRGAATGSLIQDPYFTSHIRGAKDAGLKVGIYFFSTALDEGEAVEEASMCAELCSGYGINYPIFLDVESSSRPGYNGLSVEQRTANIRAFCETISSAGYTPGLYANKTWLTGYIDTSQLDCKIWLAQYNSSGPTYNGHYDLWQFTSKGRVDGIDGNVDMDQSYLGY